jgi:hypothetical protein
MSAMQSPPSFDVDALRTGMEERNASMMRDLYTHDARLTIVDQRDQPSRPRVLASKTAIADYLDELCGRDMDHHLEQVVVSADGTHAAYLEGCRHPDGTRVTTTSMLDLRDGKIASQTCLQAWDQPAAAERTEQAAAAQQVEHVAFSRPDEVRGFGHGRAEIVHAGGGVVGRLTLEPGWRWSQDVKPVVGTEWCEAPHFQYQVSGTVRIRMADGTEFDSKAGDVTVLPSGHDAWVVGDEPVVLVDWQGALHYGEKA